MLDQAAFDCVEPAIANWPQGRAAVVALSTTLFPTGFLPTMRAGEAALDRSGAKPCRASPGLSTKRKIRGTPLSQRVVAISRPLQYRAHPYHQGAQLFVDITGGVGRLRSAPRDHRGPSLQQAPRQRRLGRPRGLQDVLRHHATDGGCPSSGSGSSDTFPSCLAQGSAAQKVAWKGNFIWRLFARQNHNCTSDFAGERVRCRCRLPCR